MNFYDEGRYNFFIQCISLFRDNFGQSKLYYKNFFWQFIGRNMNQINFFIDLFNGITILDLSDQKISFEVFKNTIKQVLYLSDEYLKIKFSPNVIEELSNSIALILFLNNQTFNSQLLSQIKNNFNFLDYEEDDLNIYFGLQAESILLSYSIKSNDLDLQELQRYNSILEKYEEKNDGIIEQYYKNRFSYCEKFLEDQSEVI